MIQAFTVGLRAVSMASLFYTRQCMTGVPIRWLKAVENELSKIVFIAQLFNCLKSLR